ncbi:MAG: molybdenum cofactor guanylyltransferase [Steroidobacteraceae bacterium]
MSLGTSSTAAQARVAGVVIAGGRSARFGGEKAAAVLAGKPLLLWAVQRLAGSCAAVAVNTRPGTASETLACAESLPVVHDAPGDAQGPLAGVKAGLAWARELGAHTLAVSPCDAPLLPQDLFIRLIEAAGCGAALAETSEGRQPLCAVWPVSALAQVTEALAGGAHPATWRMLESLGAKSVRFDPPEAFININTRADLAAAAARLERAAAMLTSGTDSR